jgi:hypothetical protein
MSGPARLCIPTGVQVRQLVAVAARFIRNNPEHRHRPAALVLGAAFTDAWPCNERSN